MSDATRSIRFQLIGGFLGAGKTTTLARLARQYTARGLTVGIVTNDQAADLVDTNALRSQGFEVGEVAGACFCCRFPDLLASIRQLDTANAPDIILAEPVGSCTDLVATVLQPLKQLYQTRFSVAPYAVILKPSQGRSILRRESGGGFSPQAAYIFEKQLEEADLILINRVDELSLSELQELQALLREQHPGTPQLAVSARTGVGFDVLIEWLDQRGDFGRRVLDIDYDIYAEGEAELGWLNSSLRLHADQSFELDAVLLDFVGRLQDSLTEAGFEVAHLKTIGLWEGCFSVANLISTTVPAELSLPSRRHVTDCDLVINARVACDPTVLAVHVEQALANACQMAGIQPGPRQTQSFKPGRPVPTHRLLPIG